MVKWLGVVGLTKLLLDEEDVRRALERLPINPKGIEEEIGNESYVNVWFYLEDDKLQIAFDTARPYSDVEDLAYLVERDYPIFYILNPKNQWKEFVEAGKGLNKNWFVWESGDGLDWNLLKHIKNACEELPELVGLFKKGWRFVYDVGLGSVGCDLLNAVVTSLNGVYEAYKGGMQMIKWLGVVGLTEDLLDEEEVREALERLSINPKEVEKKVENRLYTNVWFCLENDKVEIAFGTAHPFEDMKDLVYLVERDYPIFYILNPKTQWKKFVKAGKGLNKNWFMWNSGDTLDWDLFRDLKAYYREVPELLGLFKVDGRFFYDAELDSVNWGLIDSVVTSLNKVYEAYKKELGEKFKKDLEEVVIMNEMDVLGFLYKRLADKMKYIEIEALSKETTVEYFAYEIYNTIDAEKGVYIYLSKEAETDNDCDIYFQVTDLSYTMKVLEELNSKIKTNLKGEDN